jgi:dTDP-4-dehydrorhamnose 3,5-epimerase
MIFHQTRLRDALLIEPEIRGDERGSFARTMCRDEFAAQGVTVDFTQQNTSVSAQAGTLRGMHFQLAPHTEGKLVRCIRGAILDVIVDLRRSSPTFLAHEGYELSASNHRMLWVPPGFAHSFQTLTDDTEVTYLVTAAYAPEAERGVRYDDPRLGIAWPLPVSTISPKDASWPLLGEEQPNFFD